MTTAAGTGSPEFVVCHLIERLDQGGAENLVHALAVGMRNSRYVPIVCCLQPGTVANRLERDGVPVHNLNLARRSIAAGPAFVAFVSRLLWRITRLVRAQHVAIIHAHLPDSILTGAIAGVLTGIPIVGTYHGLGIFPAGRRRTDPRNRFRRLSYRLAGRMTDRTIAVSEPVRRLLCDEIGFDERRTVVLINGVDTDRFARAAPCSRTRTELGLDGRLVILCVGRLAAVKGQRFLIDAMRDITRRHPSAALLLVGDGPERPSLERQTRDLGLSDHIRFAGERSDVAELLAMSSVFVLPSFAEGIPLALVEAMAAGKPVVATAVPGNLDVVMNAECGRLVPPGNAPALATSICDLIDDPSTAAAVAARGQARVRTHFDSRRSIAATIALYDEVLAERGRARRKDPTA